MDQSISELNMRHSLSYTSEGYWFMLQNQLNKIAPACSRQACAFHAVACGKTVTLTAKSLPDLPIGNSQGHLC